MSVEMDRIQDENAWRAEYACAQARGMPPTQTVPARKFAADLICSLLPCTRLWTRLWAGAPPPRPATVGACSRWPLRLNIACQEQTSRR
jgi:hypothetical protein